MLTKTTRKIIDNDLLYFCSLVEFIARKTKNRRRDIIKYFSVYDINVQLRDAEINHCESFEEVSDELISKYDIKNGTFDNVSACKYQVPTYIDIGKVYRNLILNVAEEGKIGETIKKVFSSFISDEISNFNSDVYYSNPSYIYQSYLSGYMLD